MKAETRKLWDSVGGLSTPSKMPGYGYGIPAKECKLGMKLAKLVGTVCSKCYARKGRYVFGPTLKAQYRRFNKAMEAASDLFSGVTFTNNFATLLKELKETFFRWHDSGDLQSTDHLGLIADVAEGTPEINHWLPTRESGIVRDFLKKYKLPENLIVRLSGIKLNHRPDLSITGFGSMVFTAEVNPELIEDAFLCKAYTREGKCGDCRACWDKLVPLIGYPIH